MTWRQWIKRKSQHLTDLWRWRILHRRVPEDSQELGRWGEWRAGQFLRKKGFRLLLQNVRMPCGEIDWIAVDQETLVFVEVKTADFELTDRPIVAIHWKKRRRLRKASRLYLRSLHLPTPPTVRFDAVEVLLYSSHHWECRWTPHLAIP